MRLPNAPAESVRDTHEPVVDQRRDETEERAAIATTARHERALAHEEAAHEPSVQFWETRRGNVGAILALLAGLFTLGVRIWPVAPPQSHGPLGTFWAIGVTVAAAMYLLGFWLADTRQALARAVLIGGALIHLGVSILAVTLVDAQQAAPGPLAMLFDVVPAIMALIAAFLIGSRATRREVAHATR
jgi:hypothetical protein